MVNNTKELEIKLNNILENYLFELNTKDTRSKICKDIKNQIFDNIFDIEDFTSQQMIDIDVFDFRIKVDNKYYDLYDIVELNRMLKIKK